MLSPEVFVFLGSIMVVISLVGLAGAYHARHWFFTADPRTQLQLVKMPARQNRR